MWALGVIGMVRNPELYQTLSEISGPRWSCSTVEICGSAAPELFFRAGALPNTLIYTRDNISKLRGLFFKVKNH
jgi:hypothetical protein